MKEENMYSVLDLKVLYIKPVHVCIVYSGLVHSLSLSAQTLPQVRLKFIHE